MNLPEIEIREAGIKDLNHLVELWLELMEYHKDQSDVFKLRKGDQREEIAKILKSKLDDDKGKIFIAVRDQVHLGFIVSSYKVGSSAFLLYNKGYIGETLVNQKYRGLNIGKSLYKQAEKWLKSNNVDHIQLQVSTLNIKGQNFWNELGFEPVTYLMNKQI